MHYSLILYNLRYLKNKKTKNIYPALLIMLRLIIIVGIYF